MFMKKKIYKQKKVVEEGLNEPQLNYEVPKLGDIFKTISIATTEAQEEEMRNYSASLSPLQRMAYLYELICRAYGHVLNKPEENLFDKTIYIDKPKFAAK